jgi:hypothetical protein
MLLQKLFRVSKHHATKAYMKRTGETTLVLNIGERALATLIPGKEILESIGYGAKRTDTV